MKDEDDQQDLFGALEARDEALEIVLANSSIWFGKAFVLISNMRSWKGTGEDLRLLLIPQIGPPHHHNVWGSLINQAVRHGLLKRTGERRQMRTVRSHARNTDVYVSR